MDHKIEKEAEKLSPKTKWKYFGDLESSIGCCTEWDPEPRFSNKKWKSIDDTRRDDTNFSDRGIARSPLMPAMRWRLPRSHGRPLHSPTILSFPLWRRQAHPRHHQKITISPPCNLSSARSSFVTRAQQLVWHTGQKTTSAAQHAAVGQHNNKILEKLV